MLNGKTSSPCPGSAVKSVQNSKTCHAEGMKEDGNTMDIYEKLSVSYSVIMNTVKFYNVNAEICIVQMDFAFSSFTERCRSQFSVSIHCQAHCRNNVQFKIISIAWILFSLVH